MAGKRKSSPREVCSAGRYNFESCCGLHGDLTYIGSEAAACINIILYNIKATVLGMVQTLGRCNMSTHECGKPHSDVEGLGGIE